MEEEDAAMIRLICERENKSSYLKGKVKGSSSQPSLCCNPLFNTVPYIVLTSNHKTTNSTS